MNKYSILLVAALTATTAFAEAPDGYYSSLEGKCGVALKKAAKAKVANHTVINYGNDTWNAFKNTDVKVVNGTSYWWDMYSNDLVPSAAGKPDNTVMNIEHSVPNSWWGKTKNDAYKDLFHLNPSNTTANSRKGNYPLSEVGSSTWTNGVTTVGHPVSGQGGGNDMVYEPADDYKGDFARTYMYMFTVYDNISWKETTNWMYDTANELTFRPWAVELLLKWNREDPVDEKERNRNEAIYGIQHNRNPFIDMPQLAEYIWGEKNTTPFYAGNSEDPNPNPDPKPDPDPDKTILISQDFESSSIPAGWENIVSQGDLSGWFTKQFDGNTYASVTSYKGTPDGGPYEMWLITPAIEIPDGNEAFLSFRTQGAYGVDDSVMNVYQLSDSDPATASRHELTDARICTPNPDGSKPIYCDWVESGLTSLGRGPQTTYVGWRYYSAAGGSGHSATYCLDDVKVTLSTTGESGVGTIEIPAVAVEGDRILAPEGSAIYDLNGRICASENLARGLYIIALPDGKAVKVIVR